MTFRFLYSQHWEAESGSMVLEHIYILPDKNRGGEESAIVSFKDLYFLFCASWLQYHVLLPVDFLSRATIESLAKSQEKRANFVVLQRLDVAAKRGSTVYPSSLIFSSKLYYSHGTRVSRGL
jgi:hypothetical protein